MNNESTAKIQSLDNLLSIPTYRAGVAQASAYRLLSKLTESIIKQHGMTTMQWYIVGTIYDAGVNGITVSELSRAVDTNMPYITNTINLLVSKQIVERTNASNDPRSKILTIHPDFSPKVAVIEEDIRKKMREVIYDDISPQELLTYVKVLYKITNSKYSQH